MKIPEQIKSLLDGKYLDEKKDIAMMLQSITNEGYPHTAMVSVGEVVATDSEHIRIALWPNTQTANSLSEIGKASLVIVYNKKVFYFELDTKLLPPISNEKFSRMRFDAFTKNIKEDRAKYADITSGITVEMHESEEVLKRWKITIRELLSV
ncbi:pyridoxamine 5'-phosphate oxidase family protein [Staphylococcus equorum]|uniref:hypothetical protein n=1 Tax=Staphylococcus equorum TaxID=246432 RepID=UPI000D1C2BE1|nr:hypothetical protein [Staphylococcus equorum]PTE42721.1 hypothetical protein BUY77_08380 [Staphylococcus equorum]PTE78843.1 hypothetical protein BUY85_08255 [Staphylococcus equorum]PTE82697.1 hypothetical protein BUY79_12060 [Staphylococcus equorum]RIL45909.1 pyridoxamine 5'-phosphate oxidase family protein [Staphylococcus equorum]